jgi:hypothetical protein
MLKSQTRASWTVRKHIVAPQSHGFTRFPRSPACCLASSQSRDPLLLVLLPEPRISRLKLPAFRAELAGCRNPFRLQHLGEVLNHLGLAGASRSSSSVWWSVAIRARCLQLRVKEAQSVTSRHFMILAITSVGRSVSVALLRPRIWDIVSSYERKVRPSELFLTDFENAMNIARFFVGRAMMIWC